MEYHLSQKSQLFLGGVPRAVPGIETAEWKGKLRLDITGANYIYIHYMSPPPPENENVKAYLLSTMSCMFVCPQNLYDETLILNVMVLGGGTLGSELG